MATTSINIVSTEWTRITAAGESGTCWRTTAGPIVIDHTDQETAATLPLSNTNVTVEKSKRIPLDKDNDGTLNIPADNSSDIFYALSLARDNDKITVDVI